MYFRCWAEGAPLRGKQAYMKHNQYVRAPHTSGRDVAHRTRIRLINDDESAKPQGSWGTSVPHSSGKLRRPYLMENEETTPCVVCGEHPRQTTTVMFAARSHAMNRCDSAYRLTGDFSTFTARGDFVLAAAAAGEALLGELLPVDDSDRLRTSLTNFLDMARVCKQRHPSG